MFRIGDTAAVCGIRAEILLVSDIADYQPREGVGVLENEEQESLSSKGEEGRRKRRSEEEDADEMGRLNLLVPNVDLATGCSPAHLPGGPPSDLAQTLSQRILTLLHTSRLVNLDDLRIWYHPSPFSGSSPDEMDTTSTGNEGGGGPGDEVENNKAEIKAFWTLYIDILFLSLDGNPFDAAWGALIAALEDVRLPRARWDADLEMVLCDSDATQLGRLLENRGLPVPLSFGVFTEENGSEGEGEKWLLVDMDAFEEGLCREGGTVVVKGEKGGTVEILRIEKNGGGWIGPGELRELVRLANARWNQWADVMRRL